MFEGLVDSCLGRGFFNGGRRLQLAKEGPELRAGTGPHGWGAENVGFIGGSSEGRAEHSTPKSPAVDPLRSSLLTAEAVFGTFWPCLEPNWWSSAQAHSRRLHGGQYCHLGSDTSGDTFFRKSVRACADCCIKERVL